MDVSNAKITDVFLQRGYRIGPILVDFEHATLDPSEFAKMEPSISLSKYSPTVPANASSSMITSLDLSMKSDHLTYSNRASTVNGRRPSPYQKTFLCLRNKRTNTMKMYEMNRMTLGVEGIEMPRTTNLLLNKVEEEGEDVAKRRMAMKKHLVGQFGQAKGKRIYDQADRMKMDSNDQATKVSKAVMDAEGGSLTMPRESNSPILTPPCNRKAPVLSAVYSLEDIVSREDRDQIVQGAKDFILEYSDADLIRQGASKKVFSELFAQVAQHHILTGDADKVAAALYMEGLLKCIGMKTRELDQGGRGMTTVVPNLPVGIRTKIIAAFTVNNRFSPESRDRCICYALVLALLLNNYDVEFSVVTSSIKVRADMLKRLVAVVGASVQTDGPTSTNYMVLRLPLATFDANKLSMGKRKKKTA